MSSFSYPSGSGSASVYFGNPVPNVGSLPPSGTPGEIRVVIDEDTIYEWNGSAWIPVTNPDADVSGPGSSVNNEIVLFSGISGKIIKRATGTGFVKVTSGVMQTPNTTVSLTTEVSGTLPVGNGGTNSATALNNNRVIKSAGGAIVEAAAITASRALISDANGIPTSSTTTDTELGYVHNVTSAIQTQLDGKLALAGGTMLGALVLNADPALALGAATKQYVDAAANNIQWKQQVRVATTVAGTLITSFANGSTIDGILLVTGDRILIKNQVSASENGIYIVAVAGAPARSSDADTFAELNGASVYVTAGTANATKGFIQTATLTSLSDNQTWVQNFGTGLYVASGQGITLTGSTFAFQIDGSTLSQSASGAKVATGGVTNNEVNASAAIAVTKIAAITASRAVVSDGSGFISPASTTSTQIGYLSTTTSDVQTQLDAKLAATTTVNVAGNVTLTNKAIHFVDTSSARSLTLPAPATSLYIVIKDSIGTCGTNNITLVRPGSQKIETVAASYVLDNDLGSWEIVSNGTDYFII